MGLLFKSRESEKNQPTQKPAKSLLERSRESLEQPKKKSLFSRALELLGKPPGSTSKTEPRKHKGLLERARELLFGKKNETAEPAVEQEPELDLAALPLPEEVFENSFPEAIVPSEKSSVFEEVIIPDLSAEPPGKLTGEKPFSPEYHNIQIRTLPQRFQEYQALTPEELEKMPLPPLKLSHRSYDIAPPDGPYGHYGRSLRNAESFLAEGDFELAASTYSRVHEKIPDQGARSKIQENLSDISNYLQEMHEHISKQPRFITNPSSRAGGNDGDDSIRQQIAQGFIDIQKAIFEAGNLQIDAANAVINATGSGLGGSGTTSPDGPAGISTVGPLSSIAGGFAGGAAGPATSGPAGGFAGGAAGPATSGPAGGFAGGAAGPATSGPAAAGEPRQPGEPATLGEESAAAVAPMQHTPEQGFMSPPEMPALTDSNLTDDSPESEEEKPKEIQEIRGVLELKPPDEEDTPFLTLTYDFTRIPHEFVLARDHNIFEFAYYKYKPMLIKAHQYIRRKQITRALNYYRVIREQQIPEEFRKMIDQNIEDITEYLQKYLMARQ